MKKYFIAQITQLGILTHKADMKEISNTSNTFNVCWKKKKRKKLTQRRVGVANKEIFRGDCEQNFK